MCPVASLVWMGFARILHWYKHSWMPYTIAVWLIFLISKLFVEPPRYFLITPWCVHVVLGFVLQGLAASMTMSDPYQLWWNLILAELRIMVMNPRSHNVFTKELGFWLWFLLLLQCWVVFGFSLLEEFCRYWGSGFKPYTNLQAVLC